MDNTHDETDATGGIAQSDAQDQTTSHQQAPVTTQTSSPSLLRTLFGSGRKIALWASGLALILVAIVAIVAVANVVKDQSEAHDAALTSFDDALAAYKTSISDFRDRVNEGAAVESNVSADSLLDPSLLTNLETAIDEAADTESSHRRAQFSGSKSMTTEQLLEQNRLLDEDRKALDEAGKNVAAAASKVIASAEAKREADEKARQAAELAAKKSAAGAISFEDLARGGDALLGTYFRFEGEVIQDAGSGTYRVNITKDPGYSRTFWNDTILVSVVGATSQRILEDDVISFVAVSAGLASYESIFGATIELPSVIADGADVAVIGRTD